MCVQEKSIDQIFTVSELNKFIALYKLFAFVSQWSLESSKAILQIKHFNSLKHCQVQFFTLNFLWYKSICLSNKSYLQKSIFW